MDESEEEEKDQEEALVTPIAGQGSIAVASLTIGGFGVPQWQCRSGAELQEVATVAGTGAAGHQNSARVQAHLCDPQDRLVLPDNCVSVADFVNHRIGVLSVDLQEVRTRKAGAEMGAPGCSGTDQVLLPKWLRAALLMAQSW